MFKYYPETDVVRCVHGDICVISPLVEDLVPLGRLDSVPDMMRTYGLQHLDHVPFSSRISNFFRRMEFPSSLITTAFVTLATFQFCSLLSRS